MREVVIGGTTLFVHEDGRVYRGNRRLTARPHPTKRLLLVRVYRADGRPTERGLAALVCEAFHGPRPKGHDVRYKDGNHLNVSAHNLEWRVRGRLTLEQRAELREAYCSGKGTVRSIAARFNIGEEQARRIAMAPV